MMAARPRETPPMEQFHGTTILSVRRGAAVALGGDGQVTLGNIVIKAGARKVRRLYQDRILAGFAGGTADAFTLFERFEAKLDKHQGNLHALGGRARQGLAHRPHAAPPGGDARGRRPRELARSSPARATCSSPSTAWSRSAAAGRTRRPRRARCSRTPSSPPRRSSTQALAIAGDLCIYTNQQTYVDRDAGVEIDSHELRMTPQEIVHELDKHIVGQGKAKRAVAIALRNRWRRQQVAEPLRQEITPKNILMIGPTGVGKTEIARRLARLADAPFIKVEATKFTEVGYVGRDVDTIVRDLVEIAIKQTREQATRKVRTRAEDAAEERVLDALLPPARAIGFAEPRKHRDSATRQKFRKKLREGELDDKEIEIEVAATPAADGDPRAAGHGGAHLADPGHVPEPRRRAPQACAS